MRSVFSKIRAAEQSGSLYGALAIAGAGTAAMLYLREKMDVAVESITWVVPTDPWITARDPPAPQRQITCM